MKSIRIQNLKSIVDSGNIELNNMTVVIGKNSSGKSTLLRVFPLLKQSMTKRLSSPILWYGDYVDFVFIVEDGYEFPYFKENSFDKNSLFVKQNNEIVDNSLVTYYMIDETTWGLRRELGIYLEEPLTILVLFICIKAMKKK